METNEFDFVKWSETIGIFLEEVKDPNEASKLFEKYLLENGMTKTDLGDLEGDFWELRDGDRILPLIESVGTKDKLVNELKMIIDYLRINNIP